MQARYKRENIHKLLIFHNYAWHHVRVFSCTKKGSDIEFSYLSNGIYIMGHICVSFVEITFYRSKVA